MVNMASGIENCITNVLGMRVWGVRRTHGSAIFLEFGEIMKTDDTHSHGEVHLLSQLAFWRICKDDDFIVGSESSKSFIDKFFQMHEFGVVESVRTLKQGFELTISTSLGYIFDFLWFGSQYEDESVVWTIYNGNDESWAFTTEGLIRHEFNNDIT